MPISVFFQSHFDTDGWPGYYLSSPPLCPNTAGEFENGSPPLKKEA